jgi:hypothetical protein
VQAEGIRAALERTHASIHVDPKALHVIVTGIAQVLALEAGLGVRSGHEATVALAEQYLDELEPE